MVVYLDNAATTRPLPQVVTEMADVALNFYGNASSPHGLGHESKKIVERSRVVIAESLAVAPEEIYFTSGGTEANNLALRGYMMAVEARTRGRVRGDGVDAGAGMGEGAGAGMGEGAGAGGGAEASGGVSAAKGAGSSAEIVTSEVITSELEHPSVTRSIRDIKQAGHAVSYIPAVGGQFDLEAYKRALSRDTKLVSLMCVQNVFGYLLPIEEAVSLRNSYAPQAVFHSDAVQAFGCYKLRPKDVGVDMLSISAHKVGGPKGIGALYVRNGIKMFTTAFGGGQERGLRSGTEAVSLIAGFAKAVELTGSEQDRAAGLAQMRSVWQHLVHALKQAFPEVAINSREDGSPAIAHFSLPNINNKKAVEFLSQRGVYVGISAACDMAHIRSGEAVRKKHPLVARLAGLSEAEEKGSFRASFCAGTKLEDVEALVAALKEYEHSAGAKC